jgi:hypothetical protein
MPGREIDTIEFERSGQAPYLRRCDACGAIMHSCMDATPYLHWEITWFCEECLRTLPAQEIERMSREATLRGVPWS